MSTAGCGISAGDTWRLSPRFAMIAISLGSAAADRPPAPIYTKQRHARIARRAGRRCFQFAAATEHGGGEPPSNRIFHEPSACFCQVDQ